MLVLHPFLDLVMTKSTLIDTFIIVVLVVMFSPSLTRAGTPAVFILGDSLLDIGTNNYVIKATGKAKFPHYGVDFFNSTPSGRFSNGLNMADFLAKIPFGESVTSPAAYLSLFMNGQYFEDRLAKAIDFDRIRTRRRWIRPSINYTVYTAPGVRENPAVGVNFASAGTAILDVNGAVDQALSISDQISHLMFVHGNLSATMGSWKTQVLFAKSAFFLGVGNNDVHAFALTRAKLDPNKYIERVVRKYNTTLLTLYNLGARKFGIISIPYVGCSPLMRVTIPGGNCSKTANDLAQQLNDRLEQLLGNMTRYSRGMVYSFANAYDVLYDLWQHPERYNIKNTVDACCGTGRFNAMTVCHPLAKLCKNRDEYLFWDFSHPSEYATRIITDTFAYGGSEYVRPINFARLVSL